jgi:protein-tyrosine phosphatase
MTLITSQLALGGRHDPLTHSEHIEAFLCCAQELALPRNKPGYHLPIRDGAPIDGPGLEAAFRFLDEQLKAGRLILIYCGAGFSRSVAVITGYLALRTSESPKSVLRRIRKLRPAVDPSELTFQSVMQYVNEMRWKCR